MNAPRDEWHLPTTHLGRRVLLFDQLDSTSTHAAELAHDPANDGLVVLADEQTAGRGQYGRSWLCGPGMGVLLSVLLFPPPPLRRPALLTAWAAVSVCETVEQLTGLHATIKWPNDVLVKGRKVCGILIEQGRGTVVGIGLNVNQTPEMFAAADLPLAGSLKVFTNDGHETRDVARRLIHLLDEGYRRLVEGDLTTLEAAWQERLGLLRRAVWVECHDKRHAGRLLELGWDGLTLENSEGETVRFAPEAVRHVEPA